MMDNDFHIDIPEILSVVDTSEVLVIRFAVMPKRLLVDARFDALEGPLVKAVGPVGGVEERLRELRRLRPRFHLPERIMSFLWPKSVVSLQRLGVWQHIVDRCRASGHAGAVEQCQEAL